MESQERARGVDLEENAEVQAAKRATAAENGTRGRYQRSRDATGSGKLLPGRHRLCEPLASGSYPIAHQMEAQSNILCDVIVSMK
jgi:hypothetical protein